MRQDLLIFPFHLHQGIPKVHQNHPVWSGNIFEVACNCTSEGISPHWNQDGGNLSLFMAPLICHQKWRNATHETFDINQAECSYLEKETAVLCSWKLFYNCIHFPSLASKNNIYVWYRGTGIYGDVGTGPHQIILGHEPQQWVMSRLCRTRSFKSQKLHYISTTSSM